MLYTVFSPYLQLTSRKRKFYLRMVPKWKSSDTGNSVMPRRNYKLLPLSEKVFNLREEKYCMLKSLRFTVRMNLSSVTELYCSLIIVPFYFLLLLLG